MLTDIYQLEKFVELLGENVTSALAGKVIFLDKIGRISDFVELVLKVGGAFSEVCAHSQVKTGAQLTSS